MTDLHAVSPSVTRLLPRRRTVIAGTLATALAAGTAINLAAPARADDTAAFSALLDTWRTILTGGDADTSDTRVARAVSLLDDQASQELAGYSTTAPLWKDLAFAADAANVSAALVRMRTIALALSTAGCKLHGDAAVAERLVAGLRVISDTGYFSGRRTSGNWWFWEIGVPTVLSDVLVLLHASVPADLRTKLCEAMAYFAPDPNFRGRTTTGGQETGANRSDKALRCILRGALRGSSADIVLGRDALSDVRGRGALSVFAQVTSGDGYYADGSFVQHGWIAYTGTYGTVALNGVAQALAVLASSPWKVTDPQQIRMVDAVEKTYAPNIYRGVMMDPVRGRAVARQNDSGQRNALVAADATLLLATVAPEDRRAALRGRAIDWITTMPLDVEATAALATVSRWAQAEKASRQPLTDAPGHVVFAGSERFVHRRDGWAFTVSSSSSRIGRFEAGNEENVTGWYQGDGATYLQLADDPAQTNTDYWPTVDPYRLAGTTVEMSPRTELWGSAGRLERATSSWNGGTSVLGSWGVWGSELVDHDKALVGRQAWFTLEDAVVALGAGFTSTTDAAVETTVENRALHTGTPRVTVDGNVIVGAVGESSVLAAPEWAHLEGVGGYVFLTRQRTRVRRVRRRGAWWDINRGADTFGDKDVQRVDYATISLLHGKRPSGAGYAYALVPRASVQETRAFSRRYANGNGPQVLANDTTVQSISAPLRPGRLFLANAYAAATLDWLRTDGAASVAVAQEARSISVAVSDPGRASGDVTITLPGMNGRGIDAADPSVTVVDLRPVTLRIRLAGTRGLTQRITLRR